MHILLVLVIEKAGGPFNNGYENSDHPYKMDDRTPQNHMTTDPNKLWAHAEVAVKFHKKLSQLTA